ncbi:hypothetical protein P171DRAFT_444910 [Karstenula rhodostoma CBS 690.94]|uniref:Uncharacterized protein n=1 Tax=Karstenula rhodostoma CBS 690.94 TaxID=1392251 RepID=A0A9P4UBV5_9PLEO|nr:hypothetical protein P171DRAFT_444910 [Karstenula rhodostoma CBS 690.94]
MGAVLSSLIFVIVGVTIALYLHYLRHYNNKSGVSGVYSPNTREYLPGMDANLAANYRRSKYATLANLTPQEQQERSKLQDVRDHPSAYYRDAPTMDRGIRFGVPSMGFRTGAHQTMGDQSAVLGTWDHRATRPESLSHRDSVDWGSGPSFSNLRIEDQNSSAGHTDTRAAQSPYPPGMQVGGDRVDYDMGRLQLDDLCSPHSVRHRSQASSPGMVDPVQDANRAFANLRVNDQDSSATNRTHHHSQDFPPGMNNPVQSANQAFANLRIDGQEPPTANVANTVDNGNPHLPGMGYRHVFIPRGGEDM